MELKDACTKLQCIWVVVIYNRNRLKISIKNLIYTTTINIINIYRV